jgi:phage host-nuclease inhibitor protein Gam
LDASYFRQRAAVAREFAQTGDDRRLAQMLLELAIDLEAEAAAIEAEQASAAARPCQEIQPLRDYRCDLD